MEWISLSGFLLVCCASRGAAGSQSGEASTELREVGFSSLQIGILVMAFTAIAVSVSTSIPALWFLLCKSESSRARHCWLVNWCIPCIFMFVAFVLWGVIEGFMREGIMCAAVTLSRILLTLLMAPSSLKMPVTLPDVIKSRAIFFIHFVILTVMFSRFLNDLFRTHPPETHFFICVAFSAFTWVMELLLCFAKGWFQGLDRWLMLSTAMFLILNTLHDKYLDFVVGVSVTAGAMLFLPLLCPCLKKAFITIIIISFFILHLILALCFLMELMKQDKGLPGLMCDGIFLYSLAAIACCKQRDNVRVTCHMIVYMFGTSVLTVVNAVALITEMMLQADSGYRRVKDLRLIVLPFECLFLMGWLCLQTRGCCLKEKNQELNHSVAQESHPLSETKGSRVQQS